MDSFYYLTIIVFTGIFFISLGLILYFSYNQTTKTGGVDITKPYPPVQQKCPDLWTLSSNSSVCTATLSSTPSENLNKNLGSFVNQTGVYDGGQLTIAKNTFGLTTLQMTNQTGSTPAKISFDSEDPGFSKNTAKNCGKKQFSKLVNLFWEGIDNYGPC